jgi:hypothetical protein
VRSLALGSGSLQERLGVAGGVLLELVSPADFGEKEERELAELIQLAFDRVSAKSRQDRDEPSGVDISDGAARRAAADMLDLRDRLVGRVVRERLS